MSESTAASSRRAVLMGALGGALGLVAASLGRPVTASAADGDPVLQGSVNVATTATEVWNDTVSDYAFVAKNASGPAMRVIAGGGGIAIESGTGGLSAFGGTGSGVSAHADTTGYGVYGDSVSGIGVHGTAFGDKPGVDGFSNNGHGVHGAAANSTVAGTVGRNNGDGTGVIGFTGGGTFPAGKPKTGVYGQAAKDADSRGVWGYSPAGQGVRGQATSGIGVRGLVTTGVGLSGEATTGYALRTKGRVRLDQSAGQATIASGTSSVVVTPGVDLTTTSAVVATLNGDAGGSTTVKRVAINTTANTFTIYLTANATASVKLAWIVLG